MGKYLQVFKISLGQEFAYRANFILWRLRNLLQIFLIFFLWDAVFSDPDTQLFGYDRSKILTYVFVLIFVKALVLSSRVTDAAGEVSRGDLSNYLVKPVSYFKYWFSRDVSSKLLNLVFAAGEALLLFILLKPAFFVQTNLLLVFFFVVSTVLAILIVFLVMFITNSITFWIPESAWGVHFVLMVLLEILSGVLFPLDILPDKLFSLLSYTPFPYLVFFPIQVYLGNFPLPVVMKGVFISFVWVVIFTYLLKKVWGKGLKAYQSYGR